MSIKLKAPIALVVTSYEIDENGSNPTLSHVFYGKTIEEAYAVSIAHTKSDTFFSSTFVGEMEWKDDKIYIEYDGQIYSKKNIRDKTETLNRLLKKLEKEGKLSNNKQKKLKILEKVEQLSNE